MIINKKKIITNFDKFSLTCYHKKEKSKRKSMGHVNQANKSNAD